MRRYFVILIGFLIGGLLGTLAILAQERPRATQQPTPDQQPRQSDQIKVYERLDKTVSLRTKDGRTIHIHAVVRDWGIRGGEPVAEFPEQGLMIVQLRAGKVTTVINGQRQGRDEDEFWTLPAGSRMSVEVTGETAVLQTMAIRAP